MISPIFITILTISFNENFNNAAWDCSCYTAVAISDWLREHNIRCNNLFPYFGPGNKPKSALFYRSTISFRCYRHSKIAFNSLLKRRTSRAISRSGHIVWAQSLQTESFTNICGSKLFKSGQKTFYQIKGFFEHDREFSFAAVVSPCYDRSDDIKVRAPNHSV